MKYEILPALGREKGGVSSKRLRVEREYPTHQRA
jgi:hypothetical protein